ncbi:hypothetical protein K8352_16280 [Flavobacteriaceae bacterium F89]|uniref:DUF502 domain-containing protein n=1 Tax=Cerina litoralis TaxID=2874477 RepID=A0AAE3EWD7_9FLAO|nr:hypothetical protein [Cerina litoralis]MCG2462320.1 hypothetical protein [Cerina litoralis]
MKWYSSILHRILKGIVLFLLPVMVIVFLMKKAVELVRELIEPLRSLLPGKILGIGMLTFLAIAVILLICYFAGWRAEKKNLKSFLPFFEENILVFIPGYSLLKSTANDAIGDSGGDWNPVLVIDENGDRKFGIAVEEHPDGYSTVFFPEPPDAKSGEMKLIHASKLKRLNISASKLVTIVRKYGHGSISLSDNLDAKE